MHWWLNCQERLRSRKNRDRHTKQRIDRITRATPWGILWSWSDAMRRRMTNLVNKEQWDSWMKVWVSYFWHHVIGRQQSRLLLKFITQSNIVESHGRSTIKQRIMGETHYIKAWWETKGWFSSEWFVEKKNMKPRLNGKISLLATAAKVKWLNLVYVRLLLMNWCVGNVNVEECTNIL